MNEPHRPDKPFLDGEADLDKVLWDLDTAGRELPVEAIRETRRHRDAMVPKLIEVLQEASAAARSGKKREGQAPFLFCYNRNYDSGKHDNPNGVMEVAPDKRVVFHFATTGQVWSCQRDNTLQADDVDVAGHGRLHLGGNFFR